MHNCHEKWTAEYFCVFMNGKSLGLICSESIAVLKEHFQTLQFEAQKGTKTVGAQTSEKWLL
jgi:hypothetical protein